jgi:hypothetical protein
MWVMAAEDHATPADGIAQGPRQAGLAVGGAGAVGGYRM